MAALLYSVADYFRSFLWRDEHGTCVVLLRGPPDNHVVQPGETFSFEVAWLPQNQFPNTMTHIFLYIGLHGMRKDAYEPLTSKCPGSDPDVKVQKFKYRVPKYINEFATGDDIMVLEIGWGEELGCPSEDKALKCQKGGQNHHLLHTLPVDPLKGPFKASLCTPLPRNVAGGDVLVLDLATLLQSIFPSQLSSIYVCIEEDGSGTCHVCRIRNEVAGEFPQVLRGGVAYRVPENLVGQTLKIGWFHHGDLMATSNFHRCLGIVKVRQQQPFPFKPLPKKMKTFVHGRTRNATSETPIMRACLLFAAEFARAKLVQAQHQPLVTRASMHTASTFGMGLISAIGKSSVVELVEWACPYVVGPLGEGLGLEDPTQVADKFCKCTSMGTKLGSVVPGVGPVAGATAGMVAYAIGEAIENECFFSLF